MIFSKMATWRRHKIVDVDQLTDDVELLLACDSLLEMTNAPGIHRSTS